MPVVSELGKIPVPTDSKGDPFPITAPPVAASNQATSIASVD